jgi:adenylate kinase
VINILGLAGSGKSTQGQLLAKRLGCPWISMSTLLKEFGDDKVQKDILAGRIVDDAVTLHILEDYLTSMGADKNEFVIDGWPRALKQAEWLIGKVKAGQLMSTAVIHLKAHQEVARERLVHRGRVDDTDEAIAKRFSDYKEYILPILNYLGGNGLKVVDVDADLSIPEVENEIDVILGIK